LVRLAFPAKHTAGRPKEVVLHDNQVTRVLDTMIYYHADTEGGSSGSPVFDNEWNLVGLHHRGQKFPDGSADSRAILRSLIDHIIVSNDVNIADIQGDDAAIVRLDRSAADFDDTVSDHVPLVFRMVFAGGGTFVFPVRVR
jgi:trypsin-like peptidase